MWTARYKKAASFEAAFAIQGNHILKIIGVSARQQVSSSLCA
jgi:hypothetical protein